MENLENSISLLAFILGIASLIITGISKVVDHLGQKKALKELKEKEFENLLDSTDLIRLGTYLDDEIGKLSISHYVDNEKLNEKVDKLTNRLLSYVGTEDKIREEKAQHVETIENKKEKAHFLKENWPYPEKVLNEIEKIFKELYTGETWNALAKLRRFVEEFLTDLTIKNKILVDGKKKSVIKLIDILYSNRVIDTEIRNDLKFSTFICNRAIHGEDVKGEDAEAAIYVAAKAIESLINTPPNKG